MKKLYLRFKNNEEMKNGKTYKKYEVLCYKASVPQCIKQSKNKNTTKAVLLSFLAGLINGFFGGGAGLIIVVLLQKVFNLNQKQSHATALLVVLPLCVISLLLYIFTGSFDFNNSYFVVLGVIIGGVLGAVLLKKLKSSMVSIAFSCVVIVCAVKIFVDVITKC